MNVHVTGRRVVATIVDGIILGIAYNIFSAIFGTSRNDDTSGFDFTQLSFGGGFAWLLVVALYYVLMENRLGQTVGKMVTGIRVVDEQTGGRPSVGAAVARTAGRLIDGIFAYLVGFLVVLGSQRRRRLGDMFAKTLVVRA
ncbi:RDD family protein [Cryptosporangium phraense]|uniref:RDD family protein n=1 Tax=Cryptosporangium phraense TaxID=2593070 RepID=UPI001478282B|nr:RDD family protein [Cryptosporangium phraense]